MASLQELQQAFIKADDAGNTEDAQAFATQIKAMQSTTQPPVAQPKSQFLNTDAITKPYPDIAGFLGLPDKSAAGERSLANVAGSIIEPALAMGSGMIAAPIAGLAGIGQGINNAIGISDTPPADRVNSLLDKLSYSPRTQGGQVATDMLTKPFQINAEFGHRAGDPLAESGHPGWATATDTGIQMLPALLGGLRNGKTSVANGVIQRAQAISDIYGKNSTTNATISNARAMGYKLTPSVVPDSPWLAKGIQSFTGKDKTNQTMQVPNQEATNIGAIDFTGLQTKALSPDIFQKRQQALNKPYEEAAQLPAGKVGQSTVKNQATGNNVTTDIVKSGDELLSDLKLQQDISRSAQQSITNGTAGDKFEALRLQKEAADVKIDTLNTQLMKLAAANGRSDLIPLLQKAKVEKAKLHAIEDATNSATGNVNAIGLSNRENNIGGLTQQAKVIAQTATAFPDLMKVPGSTANLPINGLEALWPLLNGIADIGSVGLRPALRKAMQSDLGQKLIIDSRYAPHTAGMFDAINFTGAPATQANANRKK